MAALFASGNKSSRNLFALQKGLLKSVGISLEETHSLSYRLYSSTVLFLMLTIPFVQIRTAIMYVPDVEIVAEILVYPLFTVTVLVKLAIILKNRQHLRSLLEQLEFNEFFPNLDLSVEIGLEWVQNCTSTANTLVRRCATGVAMVTVTLITVTWGMSLTAADCHDWQFAFGPILNVTCTPYVYPVSLYQVLVMSYFGFSYVFIYFLLISVLMHLRCHFKIVQNTLKRMVGYAAKMAMKREEFSVRKDHSWIPWKNLQATVGEVVMYHNSILRLSEGFKNIFSPILLTLVLADMFLLGYMMTLTLECPNESVKCIRGVLCYLVLIALLFVVSYWGDMIHSESLAVAQACSEVDFVATNSKFQKSLVLIIRRGQEPIVFTAGGFIDLSLDTFTKILRSSYSCFMLLYNARGN